MKKRVHLIYCPPNRSQGFTLLEVIVTIVVAGIVAVFFAQFVGTGVIHSADPVYRVQNSSAVTHIMEYMNADYKKLAATQSNFLSIFKEYVGYGNLATKPQGYQGYPHYGDYEILCNKYVRFAASGTEEDDPDQLSGKILKVTIRRGDQELTCLFSR